MTAFVGYTSDETRARAERRLLIIQRNFVYKARRKRKISPEARARMAAAAHERWAKHRAERALESRDTTIESGGSPDFELDQVPDSLTEDR